jgi:hypothetical protein
MVSLSAAKSVPPTPDSRALGRAAQQRERERAARKRERARWHSERRERRSEEYRLREQQGLSSLGTEEYSSSEEDEQEEAGGQGPSDRWEPSPLSPEPTPAARAASPGAEARAAEMSGGAATGAPAAPAPSIEASRKRKRLLLFEVRGLLFCGVGCLATKCPDYLFVFMQGGADCAFPCTSQGVEGKRVRSHPAALVEGAAGGGEHGGGGGRELAGRG